MSEIAEKLKIALGNKQIDNSEYGKLPSYEDILLIKSEQPIRKQWDKLNLIRKNLLILDRYLKYNKGESLGEFLKNGNEQGMSKLVLDKIADKNDETGGIKAYFLNLQKFYDEEERKYDEMEVGAIKDDAIRERINSFMIGRVDKRRVRAEIRKDRMKKLKESGKGFFKQEEPKDLTAEGNGVEKETLKPIGKKAEVEKTETPEDKINRAKKIVVSLAGVGIVVGVGFAVYNAFKNE